MDLSKCKCLHRIKRRTWSTEYFEDPNDPKTCIIRFYHGDKKEFIGYIDMDDYEFCKSLPLYPSLTRGVYIMYSITIDGQLYNKYLHKTFLSDPNLQTDHINMNPLDNRRSNLRLVTCSENLRNASMQINNSLGRKGLAVKRNSDGSIKSIRACWTEDGKQIEKSFDVNKYTFEGALKKANELLDEMQDKNNITKSYASRITRLGF